MIYVRDIQDACSVRNALTSIQRRANLFGKDRESILLEIGMMIEEIDRNIDREEASMIETLETTLA